MQTDSGLPSPLQSWGLVASTDGSAGTLIQFTSLAKQTQNEDKGPLSRLDLMKDRSSERRRGCLPIKMHIH